MLSYYLMLLNITHCSKVNMINNYDLMCVFFNNNKKTGRAMLTINDLLWQKKKQLINKNNNTHFHTNSPLTALCAWDFRRTTG